MVEDAQIGGQIRVGELSVGAGWLIHRFDGWHAGLFVFNKNSRRVHSMDRKVGRTASTTPNSMAITLVSNSVNTGRTNRPGSG